MLRLLSKRGFSTKTEFQSNLEFLYANHTRKDKQPFFRVHSKQIEILKEPIDFYVNLHLGVRNASERVCLSSLYLGTGNLEKFLIASINGKIKRSAKLRVSMLFDYFLSLIHI
eukprot:TRINITY_DN19713_c0_g1_i1.p2 TRINITY_DN19713_c0_g1~~TRINITY_DN19713_c0_g1_i1.p2  ORF type:complete len:113 (+),score=25.45 TRINITY_DN19713_c0_g1_i1:128-466(+)